MMKKRKIFLTGLMGSGKTSCGRLLARRLGWPFLDTDALAEAKSGMKVAAIFSRFGEARFRRMEASALKSAARRPGPAVIATGGGAPMLVGNRRVMVKTGLRVFLQVPLRRLLQRLGAKGRSRRPLLAAGASKALRHLAATRAAVYRQCEIQVRADTTPGKVVERVLRQINKKKPGFFR